MCDAGARVAIERRHGGAQQLGVHRVVVAELKHVLRRRAEQRAREVADDAGVAVVLDSRMRESSKRVTVSRTSGPGRRVVVDLEHEVAEALAEDALDRLTEPARAVVGRDADGDARGHGEADGIAWRPLRLHVVYRSTGGENPKARPAYYSKLGSLRSLLRTWDACEARGELVFLNDGPVPDDRLEAMASAGTVVELPRLGQQGSYRRAIEEPQRRGWPDEDLVYLAEDDYLYRREALPALAAAAHELPAVQYLAFAGTLRGVRPGDDSRLDRLRLRLPPVARETLAAGWARGLSCTSSYGVRPVALRRDLRIHDVALRAGGSWDHTISLAHQGLAPFASRQVVAPLHRDDTWERRAKIVTWRLALTGLALARRRAPHALALADPALATHVQEGWITEGTDWEAEAATA